MTSRACTSPATRWYCSTPGTQEAPRPSPNPGQSDRHRQRIGLHGKRLRRRPGSAVGLRARQCGADRGGGRAASDDRFRRRLCDGTRRAGGERPAPGANRGDRLQFEDQVVGTDGLYEVADQVARIAALRTGVGDNFFVNLRTDLFLKAPSESHDAALAEQRSSAARPMPTRAPMASSFRASPTWRSSSGSPKPSACQSTRCTCRTGRAARSGRARALPGSATAPFHIWRCRSG